jgi:hypothetical protein
MLRLDNFGSGIPNAITNPSTVANNIAADAVPRSAIAGNTD